MHPPRVGSHDLYISLYIERVQIVVPLKSAGAEKSSPGTWSESLVAVWFRGGGVARAMLDGA
jgi:hypothetical protein